MNMRSLLPYYPDMPCYFTSHVRLLRFFPYLVYTIVHVPIFIPADTNIFDPFPNYYFSTICIHKFACLLLCAVHYSPSEYALTFTIFAPYKCI